MERCIEEEDQGVDRWPVRSMPHSWSMGEHIAKWSTGGRCADGQNGEIGSERRMRGRERAWNRRYPAGGRWLYSNYVRSGSLEDMMAHHGPSRTFDLTILLRQVSGVYCQLGICARSLSLRQTSRIDHQDTLDDLSYCC